MSHHDHPECKGDKLHCAIHLGFKVAKLALQAASVAAAFCVCKEIHKVHKSIEHHHKDHHKKLL